MWSVRWVTKGVYTIKCGIYEVKKRSNAIDSDQLPQGGGDMHFWEGVPSWMIPFDIVSFQGDWLSNLRTTLPRNITVDGRMYVLVGYTLYKEGAIYFTAAAMWRNKWWFYDGLSKHDWHLWKKLTCVDTKVLIMYYFSYSSCMHMYTAFLFALVIKYSFKSVIIIV